MYHQKLGTTQIKQGKIRDHRCDPLDATSDTTLQYEPRTASHTNSTFGQFRTVLVQFFRIKTNEVGRDDESLRLEILMELFASSRSEHQINWFIPRA
jgi:hypothetical protein